MTLYLSRRCIFNLKRGFSSLSESSLTHQWLSRFPLTLFNDHPRAKEEEEDLKSYRCMEDTIPFEMTLLSQIKTSDYLRTKKVARWSTTGHLIPFLTFLFLSIALPVLRVKDLRTSLYHMGQSWRGLADIASNHLRKQCSRRELPSWRQWLIQPCEKLESPWFAHPIRRAGLGDNIKVFNIGEQLNSFQHYLGDLSGKALSTSRRSPNFILIVYISRVAWIISLSSSAAITAHTKLLLVLLLGLLLIVLLQHVATVPTIVTFRG